MRVLHVLHTSLPVVAGYTIRSRCILEHLGRLGCELAVVSSAQHPNGETLFEIVQGIPHFRTENPRRKLPSPAKELQSMWSLQAKLSSVVHQWKPDVIHAHSPMLVGLPALQVARSKRIPLVYEVRDLWENASVDRGKFAADSPFYRAAQLMETAVFRRAQAVVTICASLRDEIAPRVAGPLHVVDNGFEASSFVPRAKNPEVMQRWGLNDRRVIGYVGTFQPYEGLDLLIRAMPKVLQQVPNAHLLITGAGGVQSELERLSSELGMQQHVTFTGRVPHQDVFDLYAAADVLAYPRISTRTTRITTPLKPVEAMAMEKPVVVSDLPAMRELVRADETGLLFRHGDCDDLARALAELLGNPERCERIGQQARAHVLEARQWGRLVERYIPIYEQARASMQ
ncbi:MAG TPA: glycosyltransferase [Polyangiaceae bacterium]|nr:glycosyltransferase [Polyangiaceae bacterium]